MSSAVNDSKIENAAEQNACSKQVSEDKSSNLMNLAPKSDDSDYLQTLRNFGVTVKCVPKRVKPVPKPILEPSEIKTEVEEPPEEEEEEELEEELEEDEEEELDLNHLLSNSSISLVPKSKPLSEVNPPLISPRTSAPPTQEEEDDPIAKLTALGCGISIQRKKSVEEKLSENVSIQLTPVKKIVSSEPSKDTNESDKNSNSVQEQILPNLPKTEAKSSEEVREPEILKTLTEKNLEAVAKELERSKSADSSRPESRIQTDNESNPPSEISITKRKRQYSTTSSKNKSRCDSRQSVASSDNFNEDSSDCHKETEVKVTVKQKRGRGRPVGSVSRNKSQSKRSHHYESDEDFKTFARSSATPRRQTRGKKIELNYSESEDSDFEQYLFDQSLSPFNFPETSQQSANLSETNASSPKKDLEATSDELKSSLPESSFESCTKASGKQTETTELNTQISKPASESFEESEKLETTITQAEAVDGSHTEVNDNFVVNDSQSRVEKLAQISGSSKISISILKNEDYSEVLRSKNNPDLTTLSVKETTEEEGPFESEIINETPSESAESCNFTDSRSVTPSATSVGYLSDSSKTDEIPSKKRRIVQATPSTTSQTERFPSDDLFCWHCKRNFSKKTLFWRHISSHIRLPFVYLTRVTLDEIEQHCGVGYKYLPPSDSKMNSLKLTLKTNNNHEFEIINKENSEMMNVEKTEEDYAEGEYDPIAETMEDNMELDETVGSNNDNMDLEDETNENNAESDEMRNMGLESNNYEESTELAEETTNEPTVEENVPESIIPDTEPVDGTEPKTEEKIEPEEPQQTYIPGVRIRSLESVQRLDNNTPDSAHSSSGNSTPTVQTSSPTLRVRTNLTSPQNNDISHLPNQLVANNMYNYQNQYNQHPYQQQPPPQMGPPPGGPQNMYSQQSVTYNSNGGYSSYSSYNQTTYVSNGNFSPNPAYWSNTGQMGSGGGPGDNVDPLSVPEEDPLKLPTSGEKEQETHGNLLKSFLDGNNQASANQLGNDNPAMAEFMPLDRLISASTCPVCSERFPDVPSLEDHKRRTNHYGGPPVSQPTSGGPPMSHSQQQQQQSSQALQPLGSTALQTLANAHGPLGPNMQPIQHQIRVQHNVIVNNVIQQQPMAPLPPYGQPQLVDNSMQQLAQQVNRMPPPNSQYGPYGANQPPPPYGTQSHYRMPALPAPPSSGQQYNQNSYGAQYGQYPNNQPIALPPPPNSTSQQNQQQYGQQQRPGSNAVALQNQQNRPNRMMGPMQQNVRPRGQAYLPTTQAGPPPPGNSMRPPSAVRSSYRPPMNRGPNGAPMGPRMQGPVSRPSGPMSMNTATRMRRPMPNSMQNQDQKRKRMDMLLPDRHEDPDCHVIAVQQRNDGDLPVIQNVQGNVQDQDPLSKAKDSMIHLTDSITLSVRGKEQNSTNNTQQSPQKPSAASAVADILATRGITVTPAAKTGNGVSQSKSGNDNNSDSVAQVAINLNNSVTLIPAQKQVERPARPASTVDLTDDGHQGSSDSIASLVRPNKPYKCSICPKQFNSQDLYTQHVTKHRTLPFRCDHCSAAYPKQADLINHKKNCRGVNNSTSSSASDLGLPVVDLRKPQVIQNLSRLGIHHYIPLAQGNNNGVFGLPVVSVDGARNPNIVNLSALGSNQLLPLGPVRQLPVSNRPH